MSDPRVGIVNLREKDGSVRKAAVRVITSGPFRGRVYEILPSGKLGQRVYLPKEKAA